MKERNKQTRKNETHVKILLMEGGHVHVENLCHRGPLQNFCPLLTSVTHTYHLRHVTDDPLSLQVLTWFNSLDIFIRSFLGAIPLIWASLPLTLRQRGAAEGWTTVRHMLQRHLLFKRCTL